MKKFLASIGLWLALSTGALAACPSGWTGLGSCDTLLDKLTNADVNAALGATITLGSGKTVTISNTVTFTATDTASVAFGAGGTVTYNAATQTLTNKTLTSPTINGGALSGTLTGTPTLSGNLTFSGVPLMTGLSGGTVVSYVGLDSGNNLVLGTPSGSGNALFGTTTGNVANDIVTMSNTTVGVKDSGITYGLTGNSVLLETTSGGLVTASTLPLATTGVRGAVIVGTGLSVTTGTITPTFGTATNQVAEGGVITGGSAGNATTVPIITYNAAGQLTTVTTATIAPALSSLTGWGTGALTAVSDAVNTSGGVITSITPGYGITITQGSANAGPIVGGSSIFLQNYPNTYTGSHNVAAAESAGADFMNDSSAATFTLIEPGQTGALAGNAYCFTNINTGATTLTIATAGAFNGAPLSSSNIVLGEYGNACPTSDGTNYNVVNFFPGYDGAQTAGDLIAFSSTIPGGFKAVTALPNGTTATTQSAGDNSTKVATTAYANTATVPPLQAISSTGNTFTGTQGFAVCTSTCTITPPVPAAGDQFCVWNDDNVSTVITLGAIGSSSYYQNTARTAYGTSGTGTLTSGGATGDLICIVGRDATHYQSISFSGTWTAS